MTVQTIAFCLLPTLPLLVRYFSHRELKRWQKWKKTATPQQIEEALDRMIGRKK